MERRSGRRYAQGTKLGPWLFLVMINDLEISSADGNVIFVDDTTSFEIVEKDKSSLMQSMADEASLWSNDNMFQVQPKKYKEMRISFKSGMSTSTTSSKRRPKDSTFCPN